MKQRLASVVALVCVLTIWTTAQEVRTPEAAKSRASEFIGSFGYLEEPKEFDCKFSPLPGNGNGVWRVMATDDSLLVNVSASDGRIVGFGDMMLGERMMSSTYGKSERIINDEAHARAVAQSFLNFAGLGSTGLTFDSVNWICNQPGAIDDLANRGTRAVVSFKERVPGREGFINFATVTLDVVQGRVEVASASTLWRYSEPATVLSKQQAVSMMQEAFERVGKAGPGQGAMDSKLALLIRNGGNGEFGSNYGEQLAGSWQSRLTWTYADDGIEAAIDAENGKPVCLYSRKQKASATRETASIVPGPNDKVVYHSDGRPVISHKKLQMPDPYGWVYKTGAGFIAGLAALVGATKVWSSRKRRG